jgi:hypothetical protein
MESSKSQRSSKIGGTSSESPHSLVACGKVITRNNGSGTRGTRPSNMESSKSQNPNPKEAPKLEGRAPRVPLSRCVREGHHPQQWKWDSWNSSLQIESSKSQTSNPKEAPKLEGRAPRVPLSRCVREGHHAQQWKWDSWNSSLQYGKFQIPKSKSQRSAKIQNSIVIDAWRDELRESHSLVACGNSSRTTMEVGLVELVPPTTMEVCAGTCNGPCLFHLGRRRRACDMDMARRATRRASGGVGRSRGRATGRRKSRTVSVRRRAASQTSWV